MCCGVVRVGVKFRVRISVRRGGDIAKISITVRVMIRIIVRVRVRVRVRG